jgi:hypothetical protein
MRGIDGVDAYFDGRELREYVGRLGARARETRLELRNARYALLPRPHRQVAPPR